MGLFISRRPAANRFICFVPANRTVCAAPGKSPQPRRADLVRPRADLTISGNAPKANGMAAAQARNRIWRSTDPQSNPPRAMAKIRLPFEPNGAAGD